MAQSKNRSWCFTIKGHEDADIKRLESLQCERLCVGKEVGEGGYAHLQGYIRFKEPVRFSWWKNQFPTAHVEVRRGKESQATEYCRKGGEVVIDRGFDCDEVVKSLTKDVEVLLVIDEIRAGAKYGQIRQRHPAFCFWHRRNVLDFMRDEKFLADYPDSDPV